MNFYLFHLILMAVCSIQCDEYYYHKQQATLTNGAKATVKAMAFKAWKNVGPVENPSNIIARITTLSITIGSATICGKICLKTPSCCGFYYKHQEFCKLVNTSRRNSTSVVKSGVHYYELVSQCTKNESLCEPHRICVPNFTNNSHSCNFPKSVRQNYHIESYGNNFYLISMKEDKKTWHDAENTCIELGGHLASLHSEEENQFLHSALSVRSYVKAWFGFNDLDDQGTYTWSDQTSTYYTHWYIPSNQPDKDDQNCALYWGISNSPYQEGTWHDGFCGGLAPYICKLV